MHYIFDMSIAKFYGTDVAIFLQNIAYWVKHNKANKTNFHEDKYWTYNSLDAFVEYFPCWSRRQIERIIKSCIDHDLIIKSNFNENKYDRTVWYTLTENGKKLFNIDDIPISPNGEIEITKRGNQNHQTVTPIPDINTDNKPKKNKESYSSPKIITKNEKQKAVPYPDDFWPDDVTRETLTYHAKRTNNSESALLRRFEDVSRQYKTRSTNWQITFVEFLERELPKRVYEDNKGQRQRYDGQSMYN